jgi:hypothetical protein
MKTSGGGSGGFTFFGLPLFFGLSAPWPGLTTPPLPAMLPAMVDSCEAAGPWLNAIVRTGDMAMEAAPVAPMDMRSDAFPESTPSAAQLGICWGPWPTVAYDMVLTEGL